ncbi:MAG: 3-deoxy-7-phosphoheptulonate synthase [Elusimicrobia bacterium]|nr:3-deoxy-7-phosphoheptulonate synthase [Elusimicrobiota bacterium]
MAPSIHDRPGPGRLIDTHIAGHLPLPTPRQIQELLPAPPACLETVAGGRRAIRDILDGKDERLFLVVGPCSIHDPRAALEYAGRLRELADKVRGRFLLVMRVYFEKPRTSVGWKGLTNDPRLDGSFRIEEGLKAARRLLLAVTRLGLPTATEALDPVAPQYLSELVCWHAIGARTIESQTHRELASGLSTPVGFKNGTDGDVQAAVDAMRSARERHSFLGVDFEGRIAVYHARGNPDTHVVLRGGRRPNYDRASIRRCADLLGAAGLRRAVMVDCSHANSGKDPLRQPSVFHSCLRHASERGSPLVGMMVESNLHGGRQDLPAGRGKLRYGVSVTDACLGWEDTERMILGRAAAARSISLGGRRDK